MRWLLTFLAGVLVGAAGLFVWLRQLPHEAPPPVVTASGHALPAPPAPPDPIAAQLPPAPKVQQDLNEADLVEADLPVKPPSEAKAALASLPDIGMPNQGKLLIPVEGVKADQLTDTFNQPRGKERQHQALDIMAPKGTRVVAAADGKVVKLFNSKPGGLTVYQFDPTGKYAYYYAHLDRYAAGLKEGMELKRGDLVGYVGSTGNANAEAPHLHFALVELTPEKQWWKGTPVDPYPLLER
jgi:murein DD-endopeptidase MepM/ murein hydrolase activator NlpD